MKRILFITLYLGIFQGRVAFSQINTDIVGKKISYFKKFEEKINSKIHVSDNDMIIPMGISRPIEYRRPEIGIPDLIVNYTFTTKDSLTYQIEYEWDSENFEGGKNNIKPVEYDKALIKKYNELEKYLNGKYGRADVSGGLNDLSKIETQAGLRRNDRWLSKDTEIYLYTILSNRYIPIDEKTEIPTHKIALYVRVRAK